jgi:hypothetical protein
MPVLTKLSLDVPFFVKNDSLLARVYANCKLYHNVFIELAKSLESLRIEKTRSEAVKMAEENSVLTRKADDELHAGMRVSLSP